MPDTNLQIRRLNDLARTKPQSVNATWVMTVGIQDLIAGDEADEDPSLAFKRNAILLRTVAAYCDWTEGNDPYGEHDFGAFDLFGARCFFKIDYYHPDRAVHAPDPANIELCRRVLTLMLAEEY
jgi:hypothetical protein